MQSDQYGRLMLNHIRLVIRVDSLSACMSYCCHSVINNGNSLAQQLQHIQALVHAARGALDTVAVHIVAGVMQSKARSGAGVLAKHATIAGKQVTYTVLRISDNKYTGKGGTDTGNRLFNTTHLK